MINTLQKIFAGIAALGLAAVCSATTVEYDWANQSGPLDSGSMTFTLGTGTANDFSAATLSSFLFTFSNGATVVLGTDGVSVTSLSGSGWSAGTNGLTSLGYLTSTAEITNGPHTAPIFTFQYQPYAGQSTAVDQTSSGVLQSFGVWKEHVSTVPLPAGAPLFIAGLLIVTVMGRRQPR